MKLKICLLLFLCPIFRGYGQDKNIKIGDKVPDITIQNVTNLEINGKKVTDFKLSALRGKLLIIDFWATWCAPCRAMIPVMDSLQRAFGDKIQFLPVTYETARAIAPVVAAIQKQKHFDLPEITGDTALAQLFPHRALPHYAWIDNSGILRAETEEKEVNGANIAAMLHGNTTMREQKADELAAYNKELPLLAGGNGSSATLRYQSLLSGFIPGLAAGMDITPADSIKGQRFTLRNIPFTWLCRLAYSDHNRWFSGARIRLLSADSAKMTTRLSGQAYSAWLKQGNGWCYELLVPPALVPCAFTIMQEDLRRLFPQYHVSVEHMQTRCLALVRTSAADKLHTAGGTPTADIGPYDCVLRNTTLSQLMKRLEVQYMQDSPLPLTDATGYKGRVDLEIHAPLSDVAALNKELARYDLKFEEKETGADLLVARDANPDQFTLKP